MTDVDRHQQLVDLIKDTQENITRTKRQLLATTDGAARASYNQILEENNARLKEAQTEMPELTFNLNSDTEKTLTRLVSNLPYPRNPHFTGRQILLKLLRSTMLEEHSVVLRPGINNHRGVGKSQIALEYAYQCENQYQLVWWLRAAEPITLGSDFAGLATALNLPEQTAIEQEVAVEAVKRWLEQNDDWLLIFDDLQQPAHLKELLPATGRGHILIISDFADWDGAIATHNIGPFSREEAVEFVLKRTAQEDEQSARALAEMFEDLPLTLELAGAYIKTTSKPLATYLSYARDHMFRLRQANRIPSASPYPFAIAASWELAYEQVRRISEGGLALLSLIAYFAPENIPLALIIEEIDHLPENLAATVIDDFKLNEALGALECFSLINFHEGKLSLHPLLQAITRDRLNQQQLGYWAGMSVKLMNAIFPYKLKTPETWPACIQLLPHALAVAGYAEELGIALDATGRLLNQLGLYVEERAEFEQARPLFQRAVTVGVTYYGPNHTIVAIRLNNLGNVLHEMGDLEGAKALYERALVIDETAYGPYNANVAIRLNNLGNVLQNLGNLEKAREVYERALAIDEKSYGPNHPKVAIRLSNLGDVKRELGELAEAQDILLRALAIDEKSYGPTHPNVAMRLNNLGNVLQDLGEMTDAKNAYQRALAIDEGNFGPHHPTVAFRLYNLGILFSKMDSLPEAKTTLERALEIFRQTMGEEHDNSQLVRQNLQGIEERLNQRVDSEAE